MSNDELLALVERLRDESLALQRAAWSRVDGGQECSLSATLADEAANQIEALSAQLAERDAEVERWHEAYRAEAHLRINNRGDR